MKVTILANFYTPVAAPAGGEKRVDYVKGQTVDEADIPAGQSAQDWIAKGLAKAVEAAPVGSEPAHEAGPAV